jgi:hypothetical protein
MLAGDFDREGQKKEEKRKGVRIQETESTRLETEGEAPKVRKTDSNEESHDRNNTGGTINSIDRC